MISRRDLLKMGGQGCLGFTCAPAVKALERLDFSRDTKAVRCINIVNFMRGVEPRAPTDLLLPVQKQMEIILEHGFPATWLLQFDALVSGPFVGYLKAHMAKDHEVGTWFEMNELHCKAAGVEWRGRPGIEWDSSPSVAFTIGYTVDERIKLADTAMQEFKSVWGKYPKSVASWNLDSITMAYLSEKYGTDAFAVCRDQIATDGFTIWGAPIAGYYPSKLNCWSPALDRASQLPSPVFRMLGQHPVYYYEDGYKLPSGKRIGEPDTMEPVWTSGRSPVFVDRFLFMISAAPTMDFAYAQLGQENNFGWPDMAEGYAMQMKALAELQKSGAVHIETMGDSGRRFKRAFATTPPQAQVMLDDPFDNTDPAEGSIWYQSRFYRADLHLKGDLPYLRDLTVYSDKNAQPFLHEATRDHDVEQRMPAVLDGFHWKADSDSGKPGAGGFFEVGGKTVRLIGKPRVKETGKKLIAELPFEGGVLEVLFDERTIQFRLIGAAGRLGILFEWDHSKSALEEVSSNRARYKWQGFDYYVELEGGPIARTANGWKAEASGTELRLRMAQAM